MFLTENNNNCTSVVGMHTKWTQYICILINYVGSGGEGKITSKF